MFKLFTGNSLNVLKKLENNSVDSVVCDPPYELGFMGKKWDSTGIAFNKALWEECLRVLKPGGHLIAFSGSRTYHRMAVAIEDAGFQIRDQILWIYGSGMPKSMNVGLAIDKHFGATRKVVGRGQRPIKGTDLHCGEVGYGGRKDEFDITAPATNEAEQWKSWGTTLKPAHEPMVLARKPLEGTVAENVLKHGTGGINIDGCRVGDETIHIHGGGGGEGTGWGKKEAIHEERTGRFPANLIHDGLPESWAKFFYCAKASKKDRNEGLEGFESKIAGGMAGRADGSLGTPVMNQNHHATVKPTTLMAYLCRLITPPGGVVLDPFNGSGSTGKACAREGFNYIGIDLSQEYIDISKARIEAELVKTKKTDSVILEKVEDPEPELTK
jgi:hypothetical protein